jgi:LysM repeat protein
VVHVVQPGQALWSIAAAYKVSLVDLYAMNGMTEDTVIYPGDKLLVKAAQTTPTVQISATLTATLVVDTPPPTRRPTRTLAAATGIPQLQKSTGTVVAPLTRAAPPERPQGRIDPLLAVIAALVLLGCAFLLFGTVLKKE